MFNILSKHTLSSAEEAGWFTDYAKYVLYNKINARKEYISVIKAFYSSIIKSCILRITLDPRYNLGIHKPLYIMLDYEAKEMNRSGQHFEESLSDKGKFIQWIHNNEVLAFYPDNNIMHLLAQKL